MGLSSQPKEFKGEVSTVRKTARTPMSNQMQKDTIDKVMITAQIPVDLKEAITQQAKDEGVPITSLVIRGLRMVLAKGF